MAVVALHRRDPLDVHHSLLTLARAGIALARRPERPSPQVRHRLRAVTAWCAIGEVAALAVAGVAVSVAALLAATALATAAVLFAAGWLARDRRARRDAARHATALDGLAEVAHAQRLHILAVAGQQAHLRAGRWQR